ncbi:hypothetical protein MBLNU459_g0384t1 [Dothideomycetes sp. NU459]
MATDHEVCIQIFSDLHLENPAAYDFFEIRPKAPYLALVGDIGHVEDKGLFDFPRQRLRQFRVVFFLLGNHEPYHISWSLAKANVRDFESLIQREREEGKNGLGKFVFLDQTRVDLSPRVTILGCTLFSRVLAEQSDYVSFGLNDFYEIKDWTVEQHSDAHAADLAWLNDQVQAIAETEPDRKIFILTHHSPTSDPRSIDPNHTSSKISSGFMTDLSAEICFKSPAVKAWAFGHTHFNCDFIDENAGLHLLTNQRGYYFSQAAKFESEKVFTI